MFKNEEGFSLLELVVAVGVAGIIAAVALPTFAGLQDKATTTSATYAASASAAEALANSTIGNTGGNGSASIQPATSITLTSVDAGNTLPAGQFFGDNVVTIGSTNAVYMLGSTQATTVLKIQGLTESKFNEIMGVLNAGAQFVEVQGLTFQLYGGGALAYTGINSWYGTYTIELALNDHPSKSGFDSWNSASDAAGLDVGGWFGPIVIRQ